MISNERGSIAPLGIGLALLSLATVLTVVAASSLFLHQKRLLTLAESAALFAFSTGEPSRALIAQANISKLGKITIAKEQILDGKTIEIRLCSFWVSPFAAVGLPLTQLVCADARSRVI